MSARQSTAHLLDEAARFVAHEARMIKASCGIGDTEWACQDCDPAKCTARKEHAAAVDLAARLAYRAHEEFRPGSLTDTGSRRP